MSKRFIVLALAAVALVLISAGLTGCSDSYKVNVTNACSTTIDVSLDGATSDAARIEAGDFHSFQVPAKGHEMFVLNLTVSRNGAVLGSHFVSVSGVTSVTVSENAEGGINITP